MSVIETLGLAALRQLDPERAHGFALRALHLGLTAKPGPVASARLATNIGKIRLPNPLGLAAGFDKNATALAPLCQAGFGFVEVGAATPKPQPGNPKPRLFRLSQDKAAINRFGFNNDGMDAITRRLEQRPTEGIIGLNLGANKDSDDRADDFARVLDRARDNLDFATVNVSSPNTERLRDLQGPDALAALLAGVMSVAGDCPIFLKISPDLDQIALRDIAQIAEGQGLAGIIATNTTLSRDGLSSPHAKEAGGLSGAPLFQRSTQVLAQLSTATTLPLIGVGGVASADQAYAKIRAGASAVQLYTGLVYHGLSLVSEILKGLDTLLERDGFASVEQAVGTDRDAWLST